MNKEQEIILVSQAVKNRVVEILNSRGMSPYKLGKDTPIAYNTIKTLMRGSNPSVNLKTVLQICKALNMKVSKFFDDPIFDSDYIDIE